MAKGNFLKGKNFFVVIGAAAVLVLVLIFFFYAKPVESESLDEIKLPPGFKINLYASELGAVNPSAPKSNLGPRMLLVHGKVLFTTLQSQGRVVALPDSDGDGRADEVKTFVGELGRPHGIDYHDGWFYIVEEDRIFRVSDYNNDLVSDVLEVIRTDLPTNAPHYSRTMKIFNNSIFISAGSSCNVCVENNSWRAAVTKCSLDGVNCTVFATGLRNAVGLTFNPLTGKLYATDNGRDRVGEDIPPDEINLVEEGGDYGWPYCFGKNVHDIWFDQNASSDPCVGKKPTLVDVQAHSAPLGLTFYYGNSFPEEYRGKLFVAFHGSSDRKELTGYKIVYVDVETGVVKDFATGWLAADDKVIGRPVDVAVAEDGALFVSDDRARKIYRIQYTG